MFVYLRVSTDALTSIYTTRLRCNKQHIRFEDTRENLPTKTYYNEMKYVNKCLEFDLTSGDE